MADKPSKQAGRGRRNAPGARSLYEIRLRKVPPLLYERLWEVANERGKPLSPTIEQLLATHPAVTVGE